MEQDPGLLLPFRLYPEKGFVLEDEARREQSRSMAYAPADAGPGDTVIIFAAIHNFSLLPTEASVPVSFYLGHPLYGGELLTNTEGNSVVFSAGPLASRARQLVQFTWVIPEEIPAFPRLYAWVDPADSFQEIHETNNIGWIILSSDGTVTEVSDQEAEPAVNPANVVVYPNPFEAVTNLKVALSDRANILLSVFNTKGQLIETLADGSYLPGDHRFQFDATHLPPGLYLYQLVVNGRVKNGKLIHQP